MTVTEAQALPYQALERAERGAALLDQLQPGWRDQIDVASLALNDCAACVLGQLYGSYQAAFTARVELGDLAFNDDGPDVAEYGFNRYIDDEDEVEGIAPWHPEWHALNQAWTHVITGR
jgi:hypothetical protein